MVPFIVLRNLTNLILFYPYLVLNLVLDLKSVVRLVMSYIDLILYIEIR